MARYLVTGAAGFIASRVSALALADGHEVVGIDNINSAYDRRLKNHRLEQLRPHKAFDFRELDICDRESLTKLFEESGRFDAVVNLAARAGVRQSVANPYVYLETNANGTLNLLELCRARGVEKFFLASTSSLYGGQNPVPFSEADSTDRPLSPYAASKKAAEALCHSFHHMHGIDVSIGRFFTVYGPAGRPDMSVFRFIQWIAEGRPVTIYGDGSQSRDFTFVDDIARGVLLSLRPLGFETINLGSDGPVELIEVLRTIERLLDKKAEIDWQPMHRADMTKTWADVSRAKELLGWEPKVTHEDGIARTVEWYQEHRPFASVIETEDVV